MTPKIPFDQIITEQLKDLITTFDFDVRVIRPDELQFSNDKCIARFIYNMGVVLCSFINPDERKNAENNPRKDGLPSGFPVYPVHTVWKFLYPNDPVNYSYTGYDIEGQVIAGKKLLLERLTNVLHGDFSWTTGYKMADASISRKIEYMMTQWALDNPVRISFRKGDPGWETKFDEYKKFHGKN